MFESVVHVEYEAWERSVPGVITGDVLWKVEVYRLALYAADIAWQDVIRLTHTRPAIAIADQLARSIGSISANIAEGFSRNSPRERARFYEYALGSARESRDWYYKARHVLSDTVTDARLELLSRIIQLLLVMIPDQRRLSIMEEPSTYASPEPDDA